MDSKKLSPGAKAFWLGIIAPAFIVNAIVFVPIALILLFVIGYCAWSVFMP